ncbi:hypothetical protein D3C71_1687010 [compost metagenome]
MRLDRCQPIGQAHGYLRLQAVSAHIALGRGERRLRHFTRYSGLEHATQHQGDRQVAVVRANVGQARPLRYMGGHALQAPGQSLFVQRKPLVLQSPAILTANAAHFKRRGTLDRAGALA